MDFHILRGLLSFPSPSPPFFVRLAFRCWHFNKNEEREREREHSERGREKTAAGYKEINPLPSSAALIVRFVFPDPRRSVFESLDRKFCRIAVEDSRLIIENF